MGKFNDRNIPKAFFWMQDASSEKDQELAETITRTLSTPPPTSAVSTPASAPTDQSNARVQLSDLQRIISSLGPGAGGNESGGGGGMRVPRGPTLQQVLSSSRLEELIINLSSEAESRLAEYLPD